MKINELCRFEVREEKSYLMCLAFEKTPVTEAQMAQGKGMGSAGAPCGEQIMSNSELLIVIFSPGFPHVK